MPAVNTQHKDYVKYLPKWERCRDATEGQDAVHAAGEKYLPRLRTQNDDDYKAYVARAPWYNASWRTVAGLVGMMFRKPPKLEVSDTVRELLKNVDMQGQPFQLFLQGRTTESMRYGRVGVLVDYPVGAPGMTLADAQALNMRPTMQAYDTFSIINWEKGVVNNEVVPTLVVLKETKVVKGDDEFSSKEEDRWRVLDLELGMTYRQRLFKVKAKQGTTNANTEYELDEEFGTKGIAYPMMQGKVMAFIPFCIIGTDSVSMEPTEPPLIDLVDTNLSHYRTSADLEHGCHFTALPMLFLAGFKTEKDALTGQEQKIYVGSEQAVVTSNEKATGQYIEFSGAGLQSLEKRREAKEQQMAVQGARMLEPQIKQVEAADTASIHRNGEESTLASIAQAVSLGMTRCLRWFSMWAGEQDASAVSVELNRVFYPAKMTPQMLSALISGWQQGAPGLSDQGLFNQLKLGEIVEEDVTLEDEQARIAEKQQENMEQQLQAQAAMLAMEGEGGGVVQ